MKKKPLKARLYQLLGTTLFPGGYERTFAEVTKKGVQRKAKKSVR
jgi:hypothetical protein